MNLRNAGGLGPGGQVQCSLQHFLDVTGAGELYARLLSAAASGARFSGGVHGGGGGGGGMHGGGMASGGAAGGGRQQLPIPHDLLRLSCFAAAAEPLSVRPSPPRPEDP